MPRVLLIIPTLDRSGAEKQLTLLATRLPAAGFDVEVIALDRGGPLAEPLREAGFGLTVLGKRGRCDPRAAFRLRSLIRQRQPDIVHTWLFSASAYGRWAVGRSRRCAVVVSERCVDSWKARWQLFVDRRLIGRTDRLVGNSQAVADFYNELGVPSSKLAVIPNGIEAPAEASRDADPAWRRELDIPEDAKIVGYVGRLARQKRLNDLVWALQLLRQSDERAYMVMVGAGPERDEVIRYATRLECLHRLRLVGHQENAADWIRRFDVFWLGSEFEGMSNSLMEAMAAGVVPVASNIPPNRELVEHGKHGYLIEVGDSVGFAQYTAKLFDQEELANELGRAAAARMRAQFSVEAMVGAYVDLYHAVLAERIPQSGVVAEPQQPSGRSAS